MASKSKCKSCKINVLYKYHCQSSYLTDTAISWELGSSTCSQVIVLLNCQNKCLNIIPFDNLIYVSIHFWIWHM